MAEEKIEQAVAQPAVKKSRRGVGSARGTQRLKFSHEHAKQNGLFIAHLDSVVVSKILIGEDKSGMPSFNGLEIPRLLLTFSSNEEEVQKRHYVTLSFTAVESNAETIPGGKSEWKINAVLDWFKHILDVYVLRGRDFTEEEEALLSLDYDDLDEEGNYSPVEPEVVIAAWTKLFTNFANILNAGREGEPYFKTKDGKIIPLWIKLLRFTKSNKKGWQAVSNGDLAFPTFTGEGCIEIFKQNVAPAIRVDSIKECITPKNIEKKPNTPVAPGMAAPFAGGVSVDAPFGGAMPNISEEAGEDMPF